MAKKKKELSAAQKKALKKGQEALKARRKAKKEEPLAETVLANAPSEVEEVNDTDLSEFSNLNEAPSSGLFDFGAENTSNDPGNGELPGALDQEEIWEFAHKKLAKLGQTPQFYVYKNNALRDVVHYPFSWSKVQKSYGGGYYKVQAKDAMNRIIKTSTLQIAEDENDYQRRNQQEAQVKQQDPTTMVSETAKMLQDIREGFKREAQERDAMSMNNNSSFNALILQMMQAQSKSQSDMNMNIMKFQMDSMSQTNQIISKMTEKFSEALEKIGDKKKGDLDPLQLMAMLDKKAELAKKETLELMDMIEKRVQAMNDDKDDSSESSGSESMSDILIKAFAPVMAQGMMGQMNQPKLNPAQEAEPQYTQEEINEYHEQQALLAKQAARRAQEFERIKNMQAEPAQQKPGSTIQRRKPDQAPVKNVNTPPAQPPVPGKPVNQAPRPVPQAPPVQKPEKIELKNETQAKQMVDNIQALILPTILQDLNAGVAATKTSTKISTILAENQVPLKIVVENVKLDDIISVAKSWQMNETQINWLRELYADLTSKQSGARRTTETISQAHV